MTAVYALCAVGYVCAILATACAHAYFTGDVVDDSQHPWRAAVLYALWPVTWLGFLYLLALIWASAAGASLRRRP